MPLGGFPHGDMRYSTYEDKGSDCFVKTYPVASKTHTELVCTGGVREDGSWVRIYPIPFRLMDKDKRYKKYQWIEIDLVKNSKDPRLESYRPFNQEDITLKGRVGTENAWEERKKSVLEKNTIYTNLKTIIEAAHNDEYSMVIFKPSKFVNFIVERLCENELSRREKKAKAFANAYTRQGVLFEELDRSYFQEMPIVPYIFRYEFYDDTEKKSYLMIEDWEINQLYWNCLKRHNNDEKVAIAKVRQKYWDDFVKTKDLHLFLGTTLEWQRRKAKNPYVIIGTFHPPYKK